MWEKIKNFFKWIADHTGISWVARKVKSGLKWLFGGKANADYKDTSQRGKSPEGEEHDQSKTTTPKTLDNEVNPDQPVPPKQPVSSNKPNFVQQNTKPGSYLEFTDNKLLFITTNENYKVLEAKCKNEDQKGKVIPGKFLVFVKCINDENFCITGSYDSQQDVSNGKKSISITSIRKQNLQSLVSSNPSEMMYQVGLDENRKFVEITRISRKPFEAPTLEQLKPNTTGNNVTQQVVNNDSNETEVKQASGSTTAGLTELPGVNSTQELSTPNNEPVKIDTPDQPKSPAVPNEPQETLVNAHGKKSEPNNAASNGKVQLGVSNEEVDEVLAQDSGKTEEIPCSEKSKRESSTINVFDRNLELRLADDIQQKLEDYKHPKNNGKYRMKIHCNKSDFNINFSERDGHLFINTLQKIGDEQVLNGIKIKSSLGFKKGSTFVVIDSIQKYQPSAKHGGQAQGSGDEPNQSSFDDESVKDDDKEADNPQPEISANGSAPTDSSSFDIVSSQATTPDELQEPDEDKELARQSEANQKAPANDDGPNLLVATPEVQTASNDKTK